MASRTFRTAVCACRRPLAAPSPATSPLRCFSATAPAMKVSGPLPTFAPTSNVELDNVLAKIRDHLFIPSHLLLRHRYLIYRKHNRPILAEEPLELEISGEPVQLRPLEAQAPVPRTDFWRALKLMALPSDLDAIPGLLEGYAQAGRPVRPKHHEALARALIRGGRTDLLLKIARGQQRYDFKFTQMLAREFMRGLLVDAERPEKEAAVKALRRAEQLLELIGPWKHDPVVRGTVLYMAASLQTRFNDGKDHRDVVRQATLQLYRPWRKVELDQWLVDGGDMASMTPKKAARAMRAVKGSVHKARHALLDYTYVLEGMRLAKGMAGSNPTKWLERKEPLLADAVGSWNAFVEKNRPLLASAQEGREMWGPGVYKRIAETVAGQQAGEEAVEAEAEDLEEQIV